jgi:hypothetical protein
MTKNKTSWGGKRSGSGQPKKAPTKTIAFRVPLELADSIKETVKSIVLEFNNIYVNKTEYFNKLTEPQEEQLDKIIKKGNEILKRQ